MSGRNKLLGATVNGVTDLLGKLGLTNDIDHLVQLELGASPLDIVGAESYILNITSDGSVIAASDKNGLFYGIMSFSCQRLKNASGYKTGYKRGHLNTQNTYPSATKNAKTFS